jgi:hypothetical protein
MPKRTNPFQKLVAAVFASMARDGSMSITESAMLPDLNGTLREIDLLLEATILGTQIRFAIECRYHKRKQGIEWIDGLIGKYQDLPVDKIFAVSGSGFSTSVLEKARRFRIEIITPEDCLERDWNAELIRIGIAEIEVQTNIDQFGFDYGVDKPTEFKDPVNGETIVHIAAQQRLVKFAELRDEVLRNQVGPSLSAHIQGIIEKAKTLSELENSLKSIDPILRVEYLRGVFFADPALEGKEISNLVFQISFAAQVRKKSVQHLRFPNKAVASSADVFGRTVTVVQPLNTNGSRDLHVNKKEDPNQNV